jgi:Flp pilus assembly protein TadD
VRLRPRFAEAHNALGVAYFGDGRHTEAADAFRRAVEIKPDYAAARYNLGAASLARGRRDEAVAQYRALRALDAGLAEKLHSGLFQGRLLDVSGRRQ